MRILRISLLLVSFIATTSILNSQNGFENIEVIYHIPGEEIDFYDGDQGPYGGGIALEYHQNKLYLATRTRLFCINFADTSHTQIDLHGLYRDPYGRGIKDIVVFRDTLFILDHFERLLLIHDDTLLNRFQLDLSDLKLKPGGYVSRPYLFYSLTSVDGELYFGNEQNVYPYSDLVFKGYKSYKDNLKGNNVLANSKMQTLLYGNPLTFCDLLINITKEQNDSLQITYHIHDSCSDTIIQKVRWINNLEYKLLISKNDIFRNDYTGSYYAVAYLSNRKKKHKTRDTKICILTINADLSIQKMIYPIPRPRGEMGMDWNLIFTNDENGNIYYLNTIFGKTTASSKVQVYKIKIN